VAIQRVFGAKSVAFELNAEDAHGHAFGQCVPFLLLDVVGPLNRARPCRDPVRRADSARPPFVQQAPLVETEDRVDLPEEQGRHGGEGTKCAISQSDVTGLEQVEEGLEHPNVVDALAGFAGGENGPAGQRTQREHLHVWKPAAGLLSGSIGVCFSVGLRVGQSNGGGVDDLYGTGPPGYARMAELGGGGGGVGHGLAQGAFGQPDSGLAVGAGAFVVPEVLGFAGRLDMADDFPAGGAWLEDLPNEAPEHQDPRILAVSPAGAVRREIRATIRQEPVELRFDVDGRRKGGDGSLAHGGYLCGELRETGGGVAFHRAVYIPPY
jgi:hypothetical protein